MLLNIILLSYMLIQRKEKHQYAKLDIGYKQVAQKSAIWAHFKRNRFGLSRCNHCGLLCRQLGNSTNILFMHLNKVHPEYIYGSALKKKNQEQYMSDFIQTMTIEGYPIDRIIEGLHKLLTKHQHRFKQIIYGFLGDLPKARNQLVDYLPKLPIDTDRNAVDKIIFQKYPDLSIGTRKALAEEYFWIYSTDQEIILNFIQNGYKIISENDQDNVGIMILITETMRQAYFRYGDSLNIDVIDKVYKKRSPNGFAEYSCWFFTGQNENMENVLFGFAIMNESIKKNLKFLFIRFFNQMSNVLPISICIPPYIILEEQIRSVCKNTNIIINWYHKLKFMKQILEQQIEHQSIMKNICECFKTQSKMEFDFLMNKIMSKVSDQDAIRYGIQKNTQKYCIFNMTLKFMGFSIQANKYLTLESQVRKLFVYQRNLAQLFIFVIKLDKKLNKSIHTDKSSKNKNYFHTLKEFKLCKHIQERIKLNLDQMMIYKIQVIDPVTIRLATRKKDCSKWKIFTLKFQIKQNYWICNCRFLYHTGIPCAHLIKILEKYGGDYRFYINSRWYKST